MRSELIKEAFELVISRMSLRPPQVEALVRVRDLLLRLPRPLGECDDHQLAEFLSFDTFSHSSHPSFLLSLATGVGKTRLAGAIMALLWLSGESSHFLFLAPSKAVLNRLRNAFNPAFREYIFIEKNLVPEPTLILADQLEDPIATGNQGLIFSEAPTIYLLTHQLVASSSRFKRQTNEFSGESPADYLRSIKDLVVISDEAHHLNETQNQETAWVAGITDLEPRLHFGLTATPPRDSKGRIRQSVNLLYEYTLQEALRQGLYTKRVELLVRPFPAQIDDSEIERSTIRYAIERLESKKVSVANAAGPRPFPIVKPVVLFFAQDTSHATGIAERLHSEFGIEIDQILLTHSKKSKTLDELELLYGIESPENPIQYVVNVQELVEGWDVTNVYVIAPLRAMASFSFAVQAMGRGLRLPAGRRTKAPELDELDVICFGRSSLESIIGQETDWSGRIPGESPAISARNWNDQRRSTSTVSVDVQRSVSIEVAELELEIPDLDLTLGPDALQRIQRMLVSRLRLAAAEVNVSAAERRASISRRVFIDATISEVIRRMPMHLADELHSAAIRHEIERWLEDQPNSSEDVQFDPIEVAAAMIQALKACAEVQPSIFKPIGTSSQLSWGAYTLAYESPVANVDGDPAADDLGAIEVLGNRTSFRCQKPYRGWKRSLHTLYSFDSWHEAKTSLLLDRSSVDWWVRNQPRRFRIETPAGMFSPDFVVGLRWEPDAKEILILEVKGDVFWAPPDSKPRLKARAAREWIAVQNSQSPIKWSFGIALESAVDHVESWEALHERLTAH